MNAVGRMVFLLNFNSMFLKSLELTLTKILLILFDKVNPKGSWKAIVWPSVNL